MAPKKVSVTYAFGRRDRIEPKLAPFGVLKVGRNLRVRKDGRLGVRHGYDALPMTTANGTLRAYDLHEYRGRLIALGSDADDGYPTEIFEYIGLDPAAAWRGTDQVSQRVTLNPFTNLREVAGIPQLDDGVTHIDSAIGGGFVCLVYVAIGGAGIYALIVDAATDQTVHAEKLPPGSANRLRVAYADGVFYVAIATTNGATAFINVYSFEPGVSTAFAAFLTGLGSSPGSTHILDMCAVANPTTARIAIAYTKTAVDLTVRVYDAAAAQVGSTITVTGVVPAAFAVEADQTDNTINVWAESQLRSYNFAGALLDGPTATTTASPLAFLGRLPAQAGFTEHIAVAVNDSNGNVVIQFWDIDTHTLTGTTTVQRAVCLSRLVSGQSLNHPMAVAFSGYVGPDLSTGEFGTNALFFVMPDCAHMTTRDVLGVKFNPAVTPFQRAYNLSRDESSGKLCWLATRDPGVEIPMPVVTLVDFQSTARRQTAAFGNLLYFAGGTPSVYDGRFAVGLNFNERPYIVSATPSNGAGSLAPSASYLYVVVWEYTLADGSVIVGPPSTQFSASTGAGQDTMAVVVATPHTVSVAAGDALFGASVSAALFRTTWNAVASIPNSTFQRCATVAVPIGMANYGELLTITDVASDADVSDEEILYTQNERGPISLPLLHDSPLACEHITATEARLLTAGLTRRSLVQVSKSAYLNEAFEFNPVDVYFSAVSGDVMGVQSLDTAKLVFTTGSIFSLGGDGPDDVGVGTLSAPVEIPTPSGLLSPWSFLEGPDGLWFQLDDTKLFRIPRGGGAPTWEGVDIEDTLLTHPTIVGTAKHKDDNAALFACNNLSVNDALILVRDFRTENWFEDVPFLIDGAAIEAMTTLGDTVAYVSGGNVYEQSRLEFADPVAQFIDAFARTHPLYPFGVGGYGLIYELLLTGEYRGDCRLELSVSYDDGRTFTGLTTFELLAADGLTVGQTIQRKWTLPQDITSSLVVDFSITATLTGPTEGFVFNQVDVLVGPEEGLRELPPDEMA